MTSSTPRHRVFLRTLGCPKNEVDGGILQRNLEQAGCEIVDDPDSADVEIVNTCGFIEATKVESLEAIWEAVDRKVRSQSQDKRLIVTGCLAQRYGHELTEQIQEIDAVVGFDRPDLVLDTLNSPERGTRACWIEKPGRLYREDALAVSWPEDKLAPLSAYIKIADGCDNACRFCAIPQIRGRMRSREQTAIVSEIRNLVNHGTKEVILVAQDTTSWGQDLANKPDLADLLHAIDAVDGSFWIRLMYAHPAFLTDRHIEAIAACGKIIPYIDMPLQHTSDRMLAIMNRHITQAETQDRIDRLRAARPDMALRTTFIIGHPGETDAEFENLFEFASENAFERMGVFPYSAEEGTPSAEMDGNVAESVIRERIERLTEAYDRWSSEFSLDRIGSVVPCLLERREGDEWEGRTVYDAPEIDGRVLATGPIDKPGLYNVRLTDAIGIDFRGEVIDAGTAAEVSGAVTQPEEIQ